MTNKRIVLIITCSIFFCTHLKAQSIRKILFKNRHEPVDTGYIKPYSEELTGRAFLSQKYTSFKIPGSANYPPFRYRPNTTVNLGIGATYRSFSLNLAYGLAVLNDDEAIRGKTKYLDLQGHFYTRKIAVDLFGQFYKGYYLATENFVPGYTGYFLRPDLRVRMVGLSAYYVFNNRRFSYRASMIQNERQTKSAGTFLMGGESYYGIVQSDFQLIPSEIANHYPQGEVNKLRFAKIGVGLGYAYTFVLQQHWFATGSVTLNPSLDFVREETHAAFKESFGISLNYMTRLAIGYNARRWIYTASWINNTVTMQGSYNEANYGISTGNYRFTVAHRFTLSKKQKDVLMGTKKS